MIKTYSELVRYNTFADRFRYLKLNGLIGEETFGIDRYLNQALYKSAIWKSIRRDVILRDNGCDLGLDGYDIYGKLFIHHMNPITKEDILNRSELVINPEYLITVSFDTHNAIHYGDDSILYFDSFVRRANDTCPWRSK